MKNYITLRKLTDQIGITQTANFCDVPYITLYSWIKGSRTPKPKQAAHVILSIDKNTDFFTDWNGVYDGIYKGVNDE